jgi:hypothetical protein
MAKEKTFSITSSIHPEYANLYLDWEKFRYVWDGGETFRDQYLKSYSTRESAIDFDIRKEISPIPGFATGAIVDIKNAIFQRTGDITREGGSQLYQDIITGKLGGVDLLGATMNYFIGNEVLPELLFMGKVGVYVDMPNIEIGQTLNQTRNAHPYFYMYKAEDICNWRLSRHGEFIEFDMLLLKERILTYDDMYSLPEKDKIRYRLLTREDGVVKVRFFNEVGEQIDINGEKTSEPTILEIKRIPFTIFEIKQSLLQNIADHQIALLNLESSDITYCLKSNFPFYVEQQSKMKSEYLKNEESKGGDDREIEVGGSTGRSYEKDVNPPGFIAPPSGPLMASMEKQKQLKEDIRSLVQLALSAIQPKYASAEAKQFDEHGLESGLSFLGLILEHGERQLTSFFAEYENDIDNVATINYPKRYSLKSDSDLLDEAEKLDDIKVKIPSKTAQKALTKLIVRKLLDTKITKDNLEIILKEIEQASYNTSDPDTIYSDHEKGLVSTETASEARGYDAKVEVPKATQDHAERIKRIKESQTNDAGARGIQDLSTDSDAAKNEKQLSQNVDLQGDGHKPIRNKEK